MIVIGWIFSALGAILSFVGVVEYNNAKSQAYGLYQYYDSSAVDNSRIVIAIGIIFFVLGVVFLIIGYLTKDKKNNNVNLLNTCQCLKCGNIVDKSKNFCPKCGNSLKVKSNKEES